MPPLKLWLRLFVVLTAVAFLYVWILPLIRPRGLYLWGHYQLRDLFLALPVGLALAYSLAILFSPVEKQFRRAVRLGFSCVVVVLTFFALDAWHSLIYLGAWQGNLYFDYASSPRSRLTIHDDELGFRRASNAVWRGNFGLNAPVQEIRLDENGFRNPSGITQADLVFIGDSYTFAGEVAEADTFVQVVGRESGLRVVNLGGAGYGASQELVVLKKFGLQYNPRYVVWQIFEGNDLRDAENFNIFRKDPKRAYISLQARYLQNSIITKLAEATLPRIPPSYAVPASFKIGSNEIRQGYLHFPYLKDRLEERAEGMEETKRTLAEGYRLCQERGIGLLVIFVPNFVRVMEPHLTFDKERDRQRFLPDNAVTHPNDFTRQLEKHSQEVGYAFIDLYPALKESATLENWPRVMIPDNEHLEIGGHLTTAHQILQWLEKPLAAQNGSRNDQ